MSLFGAIHCPQTHTFRQESWCSFIGIGEVLRRIVGKAVISIIKPDTLESAGSLQLYVGLPSGCEAIVHTLTKIYAKVSSDAILLVDASNAFNALNRKALLHNIRYICPSMATYIRISSRLFITEGSEIASTEGTTQGDPFAMPAYDVSMVPLLSMIASVNLSERTSKSTKLLMLMIL